MQGEAILSLDLAQQALPLLAQNNVNDRCNYFIYTGACHLMLGNMREASRLLHEALVQCEAAPLYSTLYTMNFVAELQIVQGKLHQAAATSQEVIRKLGGRASIHSSRASGRLGHILREWNELDQATQYVQQSIVLGEQAGLDLYLSQNYLTSAQVYWTQGKEGKALAVFSHWILDYFVHRPDLGLIGNMEKVGLGLYNYPMLAFSLEAAVLLGGLYFYMRSTRGTTFVGKYGMYVFAAFLLLMNAFTYWGPNPPSIQVAAVFNEVFYFVAAGIAVWPDRKRSPRIRADTTLIQRVSAKEAEAEAVR